MVENHLQSSAANDFCGLGLTILYARNTRPLQMHIWVLECQETSLRGILHQTTRTLFSGDFNVAHTVYVLFWGIWTQFVFNYTLSADEVRVNAFTWLCYIWQNSNFKICMFVLNLYTWHDVLLLFQNECFGFCAIFSVCFHFMYASHGLCCLHHPSTVVFSLGIEFAGFCLKARIRTRGTLKSSNSCS